MRDGAVAVRLLDPNGIAPARLVPCLGWLTEEERGRADRFATTRLRHDHVCTRVLQRLTLAGVTGLDPADFRFAAEPGGRPVVAEPVAARGIDFCLSHTGGLVACAAAHRTRIGIDVENEDGARDVEALAARFFAPAEAEAIAAAPPERRGRLFLDHWTVKEAVLKALGTGLATPLDAVRLLRLGDHDADVAFAPDLREEAGSWRILRAAPTPRHVLALAVRAPAAAVGSVPAAMPDLVWIRDLASGQGDRTRILGTGFSLPGTGRVSPGG